MYEAFYGLREKPFNLTPDPKYLYLSDKHKEAFAHLMFGIKNRSGFVMVTGEIGTGKTTICRNLLNQLEDNTQVAFIFNPALEPIELLRKINTEFGINSDLPTILDLVEALNRYLLEASAEGKSCVLVIDEAQNLSPSVLEQIRLLSNLETETEKLLQIILIGQPELGENLALKELRQLNQRITARYHLKTLSELETLQYIAYRLHVADGRKKVQFSRNAIKAVYRFSGGTPRVINALCDRALLIGYTLEATIISKAIVKRAFKEIRGEQVFHRKRSGIPFFKTTLGTVTMAALILVVLFVFMFTLARPLSQLAVQMGEFNALLKGEPKTETTVEQMVPPAAAPQPEPTVVAEVPKPELAPGLQQVANRLETVLKPKVEKTKNPAEIFAAQLADLNPDTALQAAFRSLCRDWDVSIPETLPADLSETSLQAFAQATGLTYEQLTPALDQLLAVDLPALVRLELDGQAKWVILKTADDGALSLLFSATETCEVSRDVFLNHYAEEALYFWHDPAPSTRTLLLGHTGAEVARLKKQLHDLKRLTKSNVNNQYDLRTAAAIAKIQAETGLLIDGIAGKQVRMVLTSWLKDTPGLDDKAVNEAAPAIKDAGTPESSAQPEPAVAETPEPPADEKRENSVPASEIETPDPEAEPAATPPLFSNEVLPPAPAPEAETPAETGQVSVSDLPELPLQNNTSGRPMSGRKKIVTPPVYGSVPLVPRDPEGA